MMRLRIPRGEDAVAWWGYWRMPGEAPANNLSPKPNYAD
jgi:hypothetical protein